MTSMSGTQTGGTELIEGNVNDPSEMILGSNNTGTGGSSSSEASSGHASMSDSQTSGSPPAPADYSKLTATPTSIITNFKSVLKSVPEDESGSSRLINEKSNESGNSRSGGSTHSTNGKSKGSKSRSHRNKVNSDN